MIEPESAPASRIVVSYPEDLSKWGQQKIEHASFKAYLRKAHETGVPGAQWDEFVGVGCCGNTLDVQLIVESVEDGCCLTTDTEIEFTSREACGIAGNWRVQSIAGPRT